jgi:polygalacturonase
VNDDCLNRREILGLAAASAANPYLSLLRVAGEGPWVETPRILERIRPPRFPDRHFDASRYGAMGDGKNECTTAIAKPSAECSAAGGGSVTFRGARGALRFNHGPQEFELADLHARSPGTQDNIHRS